MMGNMYHGFELWYQYSVRQEFEYVQCRLTHLSVGIMLRNLYHSFDILWYEYIWRQEFEYVLGCPTHIPVVIIYRNL